MPLHGTPCGAASDHHALSVHSLALSFSCSLSPSLGPSGPAARSEAPPPLAPTQLPAFRAGPEITGTATHTQNNPPESIFTQNARLLVEGLAHALERPLATPALALRDGLLGLGLLVGGAVERVGLLDAGAAALMVPVSNAASHLSASRHRQATGVSERTAASATKSRHPVASIERRSEHTPACNPVQIQAQ